MKTRQLPNTDSVEEMARFWDLHSLTDFDEQLEEVRGPVFERRPTTLVLHLEPSEAEAVTQIATNRGIERSELAREWVLKGLAGHLARA